MMYHGRNQLKTIITTDTRVRTGTVTTNCIVGTLSYSFPQEEQVPRICPKPSLHPQCHNYNAQLAPDISIHKLHEAQLEPQNEMAPNPILSFMCMPRFLEESRKIF